MKYRRSDRFKKSYAALSEEDKKATDKAFKLFKKDPHHPSLRTRKMSGKPGVWEGHVSVACVFTFRYSDGGDESICEFLDIGTHDIYRR